ncbi:MAG: ABC transporter substrate-binding protein, partial [Eggerthellaceae bacterium]|nr:ABC transporter substrate-binding protein [Eggerthellaceae bacterium]
IENKDNYKTAEDFKGKTIACFRMDTGHMVTKSWLRKQGLKIGKSAEEVQKGEADVAFILLEGSQAEVAAVENGEVDMCFVNSGYGVRALQGGKCAIAFQPQQLIGHEFPCCRQSTNRKAFEEKKSQLVKFEIANLRAMYDIANDKEGVIKDIVEYSGMDEDYIERITYGKDDYVAAMQFEMDPRTTDVKAFYADMIDNGDIEDKNYDLIVDHMDSSIYRTALETLIARGEHVEFYNGLMEKYKKNNTLGV